MNKFLKKFKNKTTRLAIMTTTLLATILTITLGTSLYTSRHVRTSGAYGGSGEVTIKITKPNGRGDYSTSEVQRIYKNMKNHINPTGLKSGATDSYVSGNGLITFKKSGIRNQQELDAFTQSITTKPRLGIYTPAGQPLMQNGNYRPAPFENIPATLGGAKNLDKRYQTPFEPGKAIADIQNGKWVVRVTLKQNAVDEWEKLTQSISNQTSGKTKGGSIAMWINYQQLRWKLKNIQFRMPNGMAFSDNDSLWSAIHATTPDGKPGATLAKNVFALNKLGDPKQFLISTAQVTKPLNQQQFVITLGSGSPDQLKAEATELAEKINYGSSTYEVYLKSSMFTPAEYGKTAFTKAMIAGLIVFSLIAIFMIVNYGLLGALSTIGMALYMFLTLTMFTIMRGEYSPETIASLIIGIGMAVDACIITFERLKSEVRSGNSIIKSHKIANKLSLSTIFDSNTTTIIVGFVLFFFGTGQIKGFSIMLILSIIFTLIIMLTFVRMLSSLLVNSGILKGKTWLIGVKKETINAKPSPRMQKVMNFDYVKNSKWFAIGSTAIVGISIIIFSIMAGIAGKWSSGFNSSIEFAGGSRFIITNSVNNGNNLSAQNAKEIEKLLIKNKIVTSDEIQIIYQDNKRSAARIQISSKKAINQSLISQEIKDEESRNPKAFTQKVLPNKTVVNNKFEIIGGSITSETAQNFIKEAMIAIAVAFLAIILYTLIRFKWTFSFAAIIALVHDGLIVTAVFIITRIEFSPIFVAGLLSVIGYSINDTIVTFDRIREKFKTKSGILKTPEIKEIANEAVKDTIKRSVLTSLTTITAVFVLLCFGNATKMEFNIAMLAGLISGTYSSIFIATYIWVYLESWSQKRQAARAHKNFWKLKEKEEQVIVGINDYKD